jgi:tRNA G46 methylase TrmB
LGLTNVEIVQAEASEYLATLDAASLDVVHVYHPTPYPHALHLSRRLMNADFELLLHERLKPWAILRFVTDHAGYYYDAVRLFAPRRWWAVDWQYDVPAIRLEATVGSPVEMEYRAAGVKIIHASQLVRLPSEGDNRS